MSVLATLEAVHKVAAQANGLLALALERRTIKKDVAERCVRQWREAADRMEKEVLKR